MTARRDSEGPHSDLEEEETDDESDSGASDTGGDSSDSENEDDSSERLDDQADFEKGTTSEKARKHKDTKLVRILTSYTL